MRLLRHVSIRRKLMVIILITSTLAMLLASGAFVGYEVLRFREGMVRDLTITLASTRAPERSLRPTKGRTSGPGSSRPSTDTNNTYSAPTTSRCFARSLGKTRPWVRCI